MDALPPDFISNMVVVHCYDLRQEIRKGVGVYSQAEIVEARDVVEAEVGRELIEENDARFMFCDMKYPDKTMVLYVMFDKEHEKRDSRCVGRRFWLKDGKIIQIRND